LCSPLKALDELHVAVNQQIVFSAKVKKSRKSIVLMVPF
jgi:hypothetical protein